MKVIFMLFILLVSFNCYSQKTEYQYFNTKWRNTTERRANFIRKIEKKNDTLYNVTDYFKSGEIYMKGQYFSVEPLIENGYFEFFDFFNKKKVATGYYSRGIMTGKWVFTDDNSGINRTINYDLNFISNSSPLSSNNEEDIIEVRADILPKFKNNSANSFAKYVAENLVYPPMAERYSIEETVIVKFSINDKGQVSDIETIGVANKDLEREAHRVINQGQYWSAGSSAGRPIRVHFSFPVKFVLE